MIDEQTVRGWVRDERARLLTEQQDACPHKAFGTLHDDLHVTCTECGKTVTTADETPGLRGVPPISPRSS